MQDAENISIELKKIGVSDIRESTVPSQAQILPSDILVRYSEILRRFYLMLSFFAAS